MPDISPAPTPIKFRWILGILAAFSLFALVAVYSSSMAWHHQDYDQKRAVVRYANLKALRADEAKLLSPVDAEGQPTVEWIDQAKGVVRIPINEAMVKEVETLKAKTPQSFAVPIVAPAPAPAPAPAAASSPSDTKPVPPAPSSPNGSEVPVNSHPPATAGQPNP